MTSYRYASIGSVSSGTLRTEDLLQTFVDELERVLKRQPRSFKRRPYRKLLNDATHAMRVVADGIVADDLVNELQDALSDFAPPYCYFGTVEGDGADFGFWPTIPTKRELEAGGVP